MPLNEFDYVLRCDLCGVATAGDRTYGLVVYDHASAKGNPGRHHLCAACGAELQEFLRARRSGQPRRGMTAGSPPTQRHPGDEQHRAAGEGGQRRRRRRRRRGPGAPIEPHGS